MEAALVSQEIELLILQKVLVADAQKSYYIKWVSFKVKISDLFFFLIGKGREN